MDTTHDTNNYSNDNTDDTANYYFTKTQALSYQKDRKNKCKYACGLMTETDTHTHASNDSYEHPPR